MTNNTAREADNLQNIEPPEEDDELVNVIVEAQGEYDCDPTIPHWGRHMAAAVRQYEAHQQRQAQDNDLKPPSTEETELVAELLQLNDGDAYFAVAKRLITALDEHRRRLPAQEYS